MFAKLYKSLRKDLLRFKAKMILDDLGRGFCDEYYYELKEWHQNLSWFRRKMLNLSLDDDKRPWPENVVRIRANCLWRR